MKLNSQDHSPDPTLAEVLAETGAYSKDLGWGFQVAGWQPDASYNWKWFHLRDYAVSSQSCGYYYLIPRIEYQEDSMSFTELSHFDYPSRQ